MAGYFFVLLHSENTPTLPAEYLVTFGTPEFSSGK